MPTLSYPHINMLYYHLRPFLPRRFQILLRKNVVKGKTLVCKNTWPIDRKAGRTPDGWPGWPDGKKFALVLTHDVDTGLGQKRCNHLMSIEKDLHLKSSFNFVPKRYPVSPKLRDSIVDQGFEVGVHGLYHDGRLYESYGIFAKRAQEINTYLRQWHAVGFRSPAMHHKLNWLHLLDIAYDSSTFDTDPFEPQSDGALTIFPYWVTDTGNRTYLELPYTLAQDFTLFILMKQRTIEIWKRKLAWIVEHNGMALMNIHPDYVSFNSESTYSEYSYTLYKAFLEHVLDHYAHDFWNPLPKDIASWLALTAPPVTHL